jgi:hypothetical protein
LTDLQAFQATNLQMAVKQSFAYLFDVQAESVQQQSLQ